MTSVPFQVARQIGNNLAQGFQKVDEENAIESILSQATASGDPAVLQESIGKILSKVSPERQGAAIKYLESAYANVQQKQKLAREQSAAREAGYTPGVPPQVAAQQVRDRAKSQRLSQFGFGNSGIQGKPTDNTIPTSGKNPLKEVSDDQLVMLSGAQDKEISKPAEQELKNRQEQRNITQKANDAKAKRHQDISDKTIIEANTLAKEIPIKQNALNAVEDAIASKDLSFWSWDNLAEISGIEGLRSKEGSLLKTAQKEFLLGNLGRIKGRPNQWIEQQISDMSTKIGRSTAANLSVNRSLKNELDLDKQYVKLVNEEADRLEEELGYVPRDLGARVTQKLLDYANIKEIELYNDLRAIKSLDEEKPEKYRIVEKGTPISKYVAEALLKQYNNDPKKAREEAKKLGYTY